MRHPFAPIRWDRSGWVGLAALGILAGALLISAACSPAAPAAQEKAGGAQAAARPALAPPQGLAVLPNPAVPLPIARREPQVVKVNLEAQEGVAKLDDGVEYPLWTYDGTIPGPFIRVRQGDIVELTYSNHRDNKTPHSIDLHAVTGPGGGAKLTQVNPGEVAILRFKAMNPGLYVYHCATAPIPLHISNGMYGLILVEPPAGLPAVDREFYVMQGDIYLQGQRGERGQHTFSLDKLISEQPDYVVFNGSVGSLMGDRALKAQVGETVRIFFGVGGPNTISSFHVIGEIFDRVHPEGASEPLTNVQTTLVPAGGATWVEFQLDAPGTYLLVDHSLARLFKGAVGALVVEGPEAPEIYRGIKPGADGGAH